MKRQQSSDQRAADLNRVRQAPNAPETIQALRQALKDRSTVIVTKAAQLTGELGLASLAPELIAAFERHKRDPVKTDPGCRAKTAIMDALNRLEYPNANIFLEGIRMVQYEPVWGGREDSAASLRGIAAFGLVQCGYVDVAPLLVDLMVDPEKPARQAAARAFGALGGQEGPLVLRLKLLLGDPEPEVMGECFDALFDLSGAEAVPFVARFLAPNFREQDPIDALRSGRMSTQNAIAEVAAMALGQSRCEEAFPVLQSTWERADELSFRSVLLAAIALLRMPGATELLLSVIESKAPRDATDAIRALEPFFYDSGLLEQVRERVAKRKDPALERVLRELEPED